MCILFRWGYVHVKAFLFIANLIYLLAGLLMLVLGIFAKVKPDLILTFFGEMSNAFNLLGGIITAGAIVMIILGVVVAAIGLFGCCAACCKNRKLLIAYLVVLVVVLLTQLALIIFAAAAPKKVKEIMQNEMKKSLSIFKEDVKFENGVLKKPNDTASSAWTVIQFQARCCGTYNYTDYSKLNLSVIINGMTRSASVPISCCATKETKTINLASSESYGTSDFTNLNRCLDGNYTYINPKNCYDSVSGQSRKEAYGIMAAIIGEQLLLIIFAAVMLRKDKNDKKDQSGASPKVRCIIELVQDVVSCFSFTD